MVPGMRRTQIQLDEQSYETLRRRAFERGCSISALVRELLAQSLGGQTPRRRLTVKDFPFVGAGRSRQGRLSPVSERHDEAFAEALRGTTGR
ncbi:MAG: ribbon-helix-helix protein, CopG family [Candidatus Rokubacteria bacterium]|nr:ribbon-helix-helix protein, CopG family [Candidatus Rokubacteria bacterium]